MLGRGAVAAETRAVDNHVHIIATVNHSPDTVKLPDISLTLQHPYPSCNWPRESVSKKVSPKKIAIIQQKFVRYVWNFTHAKFETYQ